MDGDLLDALEDMGYTGPLLDPTQFEQAVAKGPSSTAFTVFVSDLVKQLCQFYSIPEIVNPLQADYDPTSRSHFLLELNGFLRTFQCPHSKLTDGPLDGKLSTRADCLLLLNYLVTEMQAAQIYYSNQPESDTQPKQLEQQVEASNATLMKNMLVSLGFPKPPANIKPFDLFTKLEAKIKALLKQYPDAIGKPLLKASLSPKQWDKLLQVNRALFEEYSIRREMLLKRLDVTIQSFMWSDKVKTRQDEIAKVYQPIRRQLEAVAAVDVADLLASRDSLTLVEKVNSERRRKTTSCAVNKIVMGAVQDRGGRTGELQAPPPEMPAFKKRQEGFGSQPQRPYTADSGETKRGGRGGGRGGRVQSGWSGKGDRT